MADSISFANADELFSMMGNVGTNISGLTFEQAAALTELQNGIFVVVEGGANQAVTSLVPAADAFLDYSTSGGAISPSGAATVAPQRTANMGLAKTETGAKPVGALTLNFDTIFAIVAPLVGAKIKKELYETTPGQNLQASLERILEPFAIPGRKLFRGYVDENGTVHVNGAIVEAVKQFMREAGASPFGRAVLDPTGLSQLNHPEAFREGAILPVCRSNGLVGKYNSQGGYLGDRGWVYVQEGGATTGVRIRASNDLHSGRLIVVSTEEISGKQGYAHTPQGFTRLHPIYVPTGTRISGTPFWYTVTTWDDPFKSPAAGLPWFDPDAPVAALDIDNITGFEIVQDIATIIIDGVVEKIAGLDDYDGSVPEDYRQGAIEIATGDGSETEEYVPVRLPEFKPNADVEELPYETIPAEITTDPQSPSTRPAITPFIPTTVPEIAYPDRLAPPVPSRTSTDPSPAAEPTIDVDPTADPSVPVDPPALDFPTPTPPISGGLSPDPFIPLVTGFPTIVPSSGPGLIHVYNPTPEEFIAFGHWLWVTYADATIDKIWNNPFDGVISAHELYATPTVDGRDNIYSGFLTCPTTANLVRQRYSKIDCGSIVVPEYYGNYLDYAPYTKAHVYLPFIGIVELNSDDIIGHAVNVTYYVDAYNGSCIAQITVAKSEYSNTVYQFSGNCAVEVPLAGGSQAAIRAGMISAAATGITSVIGGVASMLGGRIGAGVSTIAYGAGAAVSQAVSNKSSVQHSGTFGASYGAMGIKKPYLIVHRPVQKEVYNYNRDYGYPAHKRVAIGDCTGYLRVREVDVISATATDEEKAKIEEMLKGGVFV